MKSRYCGMCEDVTNARECPECGADTDKLPHPVRDVSELHDPREKGDDDGREYGDPREARR